MRTHRDNRVNLVVGDDRPGVALKRGPVSPLQRMWKAGDAIAFTVPDADLLHSINAIPIGSAVPFVVTYEDYLPRVPPDRPNPWLSRQLTRRLLGDKCRRIIAMSAYAERQLAAQHSTAEYLPTLRDKMTRIYPGVPVAPDASPREPANRRPIRLCAVGYDWLRKGFPAVVQAHERLRGAGIDVETTIVSELRWSPNDYIGPAEAKLEQEYVAELRRSSVRHVPILPRPDVQALMADSDIFLFPTLHDTFGYVAIEALAAGTPVIASGTCALPEVVRSGENGVLIPMDNDPEVGKWRWVYQSRAPGYEDAYREHISRAADTIVNTVSELSQDPGKLWRMRQAALGVARERFDVRVMERSLEQVYREALRLQ